MDESMKLVRVEWADATSFSNEWLDFEEIAKLHPDGYFSVGFLIEETEDVVVLAQSKAKVGYYNIFKIPRGCVREITELHG